jgi:hypothetical protein
MVQAAMFKSWLGYKGGVEYLNRLWPIFLVTQAEEALENVDTLADPDAVGARRALLDAVECHGRTFLRCLVLL